MFQIHRHTRFCFYLLHLKNLKIASFRTLLEKILKYSGDLILIIELSRYGERKIPYLRKIISTNNQRISGNTVFCVIFHLFTLFLFSGNPESIEAATELGLLYLKIGDVQRAFQQFGTAVAHSPNCTRAILPIAFIIQVSTLLSNHTCIGNGSYCISNRGEIVSTLMNKLARTFYFIFLQVFEDEDSVFLGNLMRELSQEFLFYIFESINNNLN